MKNAVPVPILNNDSLEDWLQQFETLHHYPLYQMIAQEALDYPT